MASSRAVACVNRSPAGDGKMNSGASSVAASCGSVAGPEIASMTSPQGSGFMTMPAPPP